MEIKGASYRNPFSPSTMFMVLGIKFRGVRFGTQYLYDLNFLDESCSLWNVLFTFSQTNNMTMAE